MNSGSITNTCIHVLPSQNLRKEMRYIVKYISLYILLCVFVCVGLCSVAQSCPTRDIMDCRPPGSSVHGDFPGKKTGVGCHFLLYGIFWTQRSNLHLLHWQMDSLPLSHLGSPLLFRIPGTEEPGGLPSMGSHRVGHQ